MSLSNRNQVLLEIPQGIPFSVSAFSTAGAFQRAKLNQPCLEALRQWLQEEFDWVAKPYPNHAALPSIWEVVNGTALTCNHLRFVIIPSEAITMDELRVPQEWVDIPDWAADYYVTMQLDPEEGWIQILGYTSYQQLKAHGIYDLDDRTYSLDIEDLLQDINSLLIAMQLSLQGSVRHEGSPLPHLSPVQANNLLERLGNPSLVFPRLAIPFSQWGALLAHGGWRQQLYQRRQGFMLETVSQWIQGRVSAFAQQAGWQRRTLPAVAGVRSLNAVVARTLTIAGHPYELRVFPVGGLSSQTWRFELRSATPSQLLPAGFTLRLLTEDLQSMAHNEDIAIAPVESLQVDVILEPGEGIVWETDPQPEEYDREILRF